MDNVADTQLVRRRILPIAIAICLGVGLNGVASIGRAEDYPQKELTFVVPGTAGGGMDVIARVVADRLSKDLGQPIVVENKPGAGGNIAVDYVAKSEPDGYTILVGQTAHFSINPSLYDNLAFDPAKDFSPIALLANAPNVVVVPKGSPIKNVAELIAVAKEKNGAMTLATPGNGTVSHLTGELLQQTADIHLNHIPYKGAAAALVDVVGGRIDFMLSSIPTALSQIRAGALRPIAVSADRRSPTLPEVPTIEEQGYPGFNAGTWYGLFAPAGTDPSIIKKLNAAIAVALQNEEVLKRIVDEGGDAMSKTPEEFGAMVKSDSEKWSKLIATAGITLQ
ncbi:tripartite tricarboxylate transporter substrate binding protein [Ensifer adhaerens]|uniref:Bug family tripartite tricarboxylate transporter substrate binding protein n=1 Tax=Ensifer adhaerens TaxID=106592 RepID=UPI0023A96841|nr:tripartite tricarboxylate transporter substrate binding protein [Ensifer adhaerens]WDZ76232.1 tripartite tricarboxylate transporter substrate binding protein [Ensifer adhaerens]